MPRRRAVGARRPQIDVTTADVSPGDPFPDFALEFFQRQYAKDDGVVVNDRPVKRRKIEEKNEVDSVLIFEDAIIVKRPSDGEFVNIDPFRLPHIHALLRFELSEVIPTEDDTNDGPDHILTISTRPTLRSDNFSISLPLTTAVEISTETIAILKYASDSSWSNPNMEDAVWVSADAVIEAEGAITTLTLSFQLRCNMSTTPFAPTFAPSHRTFRREMLARAFPDMFGHSTEEQPQSCSPALFYEAAHVPDPEDTPSEDLRIPDVTAKLYPFQRRAVKWMLSREGVAWDQDTQGNSLVKDVGYQHFDAPSAFQKMQDLGGTQYYISPLLGKVTKDTTPFRDLEQNFRGGVLSEEMGLGKTVELITLFSLHRAPSQPQTAFDNYLGEIVTNTAATLIVCPSSLRKQWLSEIAKHAPSLRVMHYMGLSQSAREEADKAEALIEKLASHDVVVTTYNVLTSELAYALGEPDRARRAPRKYHRPVSPLTQLCWWRVCMDEAQMIESGVSKAATLARLIPRVNAWGVTGTPVKDSVEDLRGLLLFLRYEPFASNITAWNTLVRHRQDGFAQLFNHLALRHSKRLVRHEIYIPTQKRYVITMPFTAVEEQNYQSLFKEVIEACGLGPTGEPLRDDWDPDDARVLEAMRTALDRLRQTALHPEVGRRNRKALGQGQKTGPMRTVAEVLDAMIEQSDISIRADQRVLFMNRLTRGQLFEDSPRVREALAIWQEVLTATGGIVEACRKNLDHEMSLAKSSNGDANCSHGVDDSDAEADEINSGKVGEARRRLRSALEVQHRAIFFCANAHFQIKSNPEMTDPESDEFRRLERLESDGYDEAKLIRREILEESRQKALRRMDKISRLANKQGFVTIPEYDNIEYQGIESRAIADGLEVLAGELNVQADQLDVWRESVIQLLLKPLVDEDDDIELTGEEYEDSTKLMEEIVVYVQILRTAIADRDDVLTGQVNELVKHEATTSLRQANAGEGPSPELLLELFQIRDNVKPQSQRSLRAAVFELRSISVRLRSEAKDGSKRAQIELDILNRHLKSTQKQLLEQQKTSQAMIHELDLFTTTMNARVEFYRQLQGVSDMVAPYKGARGQNTENLMLDAEDRLQRKLEALQAKHRYLLHLRDMDSANQESRMCIICREDFTIGVLTVCGHQFCKECITLWFKASHNCPVCKKSLQASSLHDITLKPQELKVHSDNTGPEHLHVTKSNGGRKSSTKKAEIYTEFSADKLTDIRNIDLLGPAFTTKIDNLVRHLLWLRENDPGAKSIIFSQYAEFLSVLAVVLRSHKIGFSSFEKPNGIEAFKEDPSVECFLLHARAHASGLNLVNASHVFLCEPLINPALELQAIARVHRIGQEQETTVWLYIVDGTVEESIYNISVRRRMEHITDQRIHNKSNTTTKAYTKGKGKGNASSSDSNAANFDPESVDDEVIEAANSAELEHASLSKLMGRGKAQGEAVDKGDLWECLFGHLHHQQQRNGNSGVDIANGGVPSNGGNNDATTVNGSGGGSGTRNPGPAIRGFLAAEAAEQRRLDGDDAGGAGASCSS
ncbi:SNF2 family N-terminal domain-domain-containing protein [Coniella lustricola]|uniref:SNF2 family N-terminal domain-domain-containing protein n=1 Tax=Coniella lustricola TaxID=2025994 RepID=A0A2T2ZXR7_9PEZI|nr:SNF2 family N-terminal domain-domain-containing protein [Coniella lustricola]